MGKRGPKPKLPEIVRLEGNPGKRPVFDAQVGAYGEPFIPEHLMDDARGCIEVIKRSMPAEVYSALDSFHLATFATAWAIHKQAATELSNPNFEWITVSARGGEHPSPWLRILSEQARIMAMYGDRLGLDPKSRAALRLPGDDKPKSKFDGLIGPSESSDLWNA